MSAIWYNPPPVLPDGQDYCLVCLMKAKHQLADTHQDKIKAAVDDGRDSETYVIGWDKKLRVDAAVATGLSSDAPELGMIRVCWTHLSWVEVNRSPLARAQQLPPGLIGPN